MSLLLVLAALAVVGVVAAVAVGAVGGGLPAPERERPRARLPPVEPGALHEGDLAGLRLSTAVRGYRMDEVDAVLDRLRAELAARDAPPAAGAHPTRPPDPTLPTPRS